MSTFGRGSRSALDLSRVCLMASVVVMGALVSQRAALAQVDPCSLLTIEEVEAVTGAVEIETSGFGDMCTWLGTTPEDNGFLTVQLVLDVIDAEDYVSMLPYEPIEVAGFPGFGNLEDGLAMIAVQLPDSAPWLSVNATSDLDTTTAATDLLTLIIGRIAPGATPVAATPSPAAPTLGLSTPGPPAPTAIPTPTQLPATPAPPSPTPTPYVMPAGDAVACQAALETADLSKVVSVDAIAACRFTQGGEDAARVVLTTGGGRDTRWASTWVYATTGRDPAPLLPRLGDEEPSIRAMAAAALLALGERDALDVLVGSVTDQDILLGSRPPIAISAYVQAILDRFVSTEGALAAPSASPDAATQADAWQAWLETNADLLVFDPATGMWALP